MKNGGLQECVSSSPLPVRLVMSPAPKALDTGGVEFIP